MPHVPHVQRLKPLTSHMQAHDPYQLNYHTNFLLYAIIHATFVHLSSQILFKVLARHEASNTYRYFQLVY